MKSSCSGLEISAHVVSLERRSDVLIQAMTHLFEQGQIQHHEAFPDHFGPVGDRTAIAHYLQSFLKPRNPLRKRYGLAKGLYINNYICGYLLYRLYENHDPFYGKTRWYCFVEDIVVDQAARGTGGGSMMMSALIEDVSPLKDCVMSGNVWRLNTASEALFQKHGFEPLSQKFVRVFK